MDGGPKCWQGHLSPIPVPVLGCSPIPYSSVPLGLATTHLTTPLLFLGVGGLGGLGPLGLQPGEH